MKKMYLPFTSPAILSLQFFILSLFFSLCQTKSKLRNLDTAKLNIAIKFKFNMKKKIGEVNMGEERTSNIKEINGGEGEEGRKKERPPQSKWGNGTMCAHMVVGYFSPHFTPFSHLYYPI